MKTREGLIVIYNETIPYRFAPLFLLSAVVVIVLSLFHPVFAQIPLPPKKTIALLSDGQSDSQNNLTIRFQKALEILAEGEIKPVFKKSTGADWQREKAAIVLKKALADPAVDLVFINGPLLAAQALKTAQKTEKPIVGLFNFDPGFLLTVPSVKRLPLALSVIPGQIQADLETMARMFKTRGLTILVDDVLLGQFKGLKQQLLNIAKKQGFTATIRPIRKTVPETLASLNKKVKAVYLTPGLRMPASQRKQLIGKLNEKGTFVFTGAGAVDVQDGALAGQLPPMNERLARHAALNAMRFFSEMRL